MAGAFRYECCVAIIRGHALDVVPLVGMGSTVMVKSFLFAFIAGFFALLGTDAGAGSEEFLLDSGNTAWMITASALVLFMTLPGLVFFYAGLVRSRNVLSVMFHGAVIACIASILWLAFGYSLSFSDGGEYQHWIGSLDNLFLSGIDHNTLMPSGIPEYVFFLFQMTFAIITPALVIGAWVERISLFAVVLFTIGFLTLIYFPVAHWIWGGGWLAEMGVLDFAGGLVVHATAGSSALILALTLRRREGFPTRLSLPHSPGMTMAGASMLWVGWYGFNGGSALAADGLAGSALVATHISAAAASLVWVICDRIILGKSTLIGLVTGTIAGLASITPASGFVSPIGAMAIGTIGGLFCYGAVILFKQKLRIDDSLDVFAVHGVGGITGTILIAPLASAAFGGIGVDISISDQLQTQIIGTLAVIAWSVVATLLIVAFIRFFGPLGVTRYQEIEGLDISHHGEKGYEL